MIRRKRRIPSEDLRGFSGSDRASGPLRAVFRGSQRKTNRYAVVIGSGGRTSVFRHSAKRVVWSVVADWPDRGMDVLFIFLKKPERPTQESIRSALAELYKKIFPNP